MASTRPERSAVAPCIQRACDIAAAGDQASAAGSYSSAAESKEGRPPATSTLPDGRSDAGGRAGALATGAAEGHESVAGSYSSADASRVGPPDGCRSLMPPATGTSP